MDTSIPLVVPLAAADSLTEEWVGGKAVKLSALQSLGYRVPDGFCITAQAYRRFVEFGKLQKTIDMEMGRKPMSARLKQNPRPAWSVLGRPGSS